MERAFVLTLLQENERLQETNKKLDAKKIRVLMKPGDDATHIIVLTGDYVLSSSFWIHNHIQFQFDEGIAIRSEGFESFVKEFELPKHTNQITVVSGWSTMIYVHDGRGFTIQTTGDLRCGFIHEKDGFDIIRHMQQHMNLVIVGKARVRTNVFSTYSNPDGFTI